MIREQVYSLLGNQFLAVVGSSNYVPLHFGVPSTSKLKTLPTVTCIPLTKLCILVVLPVSPYTPVSRTEPGASGLLGTLVNEPIDVPFCYIPW